VVVGGDCGHSRVWVVAVAAEGGAGGLFEAWGAVAVSDDGGVCAASVR
jgi:hypothetical protein